MDKIKLPKLVKRRDKKKILLLVIEEFFYQGDKNKEFLLQGNSIENLIY